MLSNYADDNNLFSIGRDLTKVKDTLPKDFGIVTNCFYTISGKSKELCKKTSSTITSSLKRTCPFFSK